MPDDTEGFEAFSPEQTDEWLREDLRRRSAMKIKVNWSRQHQGYLVLTNPLIHTSGDLTSFSWYPIALFVITL